MPILIIDLDEVVARKYAEKKYNEFTKRLTNKEKIFAQYLEDYDYITLKRLNQMRDEQTELQNPADVQEIDELFDKKASKTLDSHVLLFNLEKLVG
ncbi:hypothetical protein BH747_09870 [Enterococcus villorum]|uniref:Uncharacterized protein n=1 Tax=Enterococcus villorum TaxID=112904 RepID=A0A1V8YAD2_9ENTE|nr:hypothetical protein [Enterococcus villorum]OQO69568.1 hypothetical protein BH747_09870 [Enterococcus villorum]OQO72641.1 hypothetical protein BH744_11230 [Enterococcus villorum]